MLLNRKEMSGCEPTGKFTLLDSKKGLYEHNFLPALFFPVRNFFRSNITELLIVSVEVGGFDGIFFVRIKILLVSRFFPIFRREELLL